MASLWSEARVSAELIRTLDFDSDFFGVRIAQAVPTRLTDDIASKMAEECERRAIQCLYLCPDACDWETVRICERRGFSFAGLKLTMICGRPASTRAVDAPGVRPACASDMAALRRIARISHRNTRFYCDGHFATERCDDLYDLWISRSCRGELADAVFVAEVDGNAAGYITCTCQAPAQGKIGLFAVAPEFRGKGLSRQLIQTALDWFWARGATEAATVTQGSSVEAVRAYERRGFVAERMQFWYHGWFGG